MDNCKHCYWWRPPDGQLHWSDKYKDLGKCELSRVANGKKIHRTGKILAWPNDNGHGVVFTAPDFGCIQFKAKAD